MNNTSKNPLHTASRISKTRSYFFNQKCQQPIDLIKMVNSKISKRNISMISYKNRNSTSRHDPKSIFIRQRSEERRVGKECRYRWWTSQSRENVIERAQWGGVR